ncbi:MAG: restriction endonuclease subunit S [Saprospiraceae bacterium]|nr:restriction endonuclease subunit S [Saprospiraceae bacterium]
MVKENSKCQPYFLAIQLDNYKNQIISNAIGSSQKAITIVVLKNQIISLPSSLEEQTKIATILRNMDSNITSLENILSKVQNIKQGIMQQLLTGKIRLV